MDFNKVTQSMIDVSNKIVNAHNNGFILSDAIVCRLNLLVMTNHIRNVYDNHFSEEQKEVINNLYIEII